MRTHTQYYAGSEYHTQLATSLQVSTKSSISQLSCILFFYNVSGNLFLSFSPNATAPNDTPGGNNNELRYFHRRAASTLRRTIPVRSESGLTACEIKRKTEFLVIFFRFSKSSCYEMTWASTPVPFPPASSMKVAFLVRRHRADRAEYLRNKDASMTEAERRGLTPHPVVLVCDNVRYVCNSLRGTNHVKV